MTFINWCSKRQSTIETSAFGTELLAFNTVMETLYAIKYKLRMMSILISEPTNIHDKNMLVIYSASTPELTSKKKCNAISYHAIHKSVAMRE